MAKSEKFDEGFNEYDINENHFSLIHIKEKYYELITKINQRTAFYMYDPSEIIIRKGLFPRFRNAFLDLNERGRILFIYGDYTTGKSFLIRYFAWLCKVKFSSYWKTTKDGRKTHPIIIKNLIDSIRSVEGFYTWLLESLGNPVDPRQLKEWEKTKVKLVKLRKRVIKTLDAYETRLLILDESQRLLKAGDKHQIAGIFEALKDLTTKNHWDELGCTHRPYFVLCGTTDCLYLLRAGKFIQGRVHTCPLESISVDKYHEFLATIYTDFINLGVSNKWDLFYKQGDELIINEEIGMTLFERTQGKAGLTVEIVRHAVLDALEHGNEYPKLNNYKEVILEGTKYIIKKESIDEKNAINIEEDDEEQINPQSEEKINTRKAIQVIIDDKTLLCAFRGCPKSKKPYKRDWYLINHYKTEHPEVELYDNEGNRLDNN